MSKIDRLRKHYDSTDQSEALEGAVFEAGHGDDILVSTSIRLSKGTLDAVRARAKVAGVPATTLMREWIEACVLGGQEPMVVSVADLEKLIAATAHRSW